MSSLALSFNEVNFTPVQQNGQIWLTATELAKALGYAKSDAVTQVYERNQDEFNSSMTLTLNLSVNDSVETLNLSVSKKSKNLTKTIRIFSLRGCHLIAMFSKTDIAKQFRKWVLDILDREVGQPIAKTHKSERTPLHDAHAMLVAKTKHLNSSEAWKIINQRFGTNSIDEIPYEAIPVAVEYVHHLIALYSSAGKQGSLFDTDLYELVRELTEAILSQNFMMQDVWKAIMLINQKDMVYYSRYVTSSNVLARKVSIELDFKTICGKPLIDPYCRTINFLGGHRMGANPKWFDASAW
ncbi:MAG: BRO family protein [Acinetobacter sp.]